MRLFPHGNRLFSFLDNCFYYAIADRLQQIKKPLLVGKDAPDLNSGGFEITISSRRFLLKKQDNGGRGKVALL